MFTVTRKVGQQVTFVQSINGLPLVINPSSSVITDQIITDEYQLIRETNDKVIMSSSLLVSNWEGYRLFCFPFNTSDETETVNHLINQFSLTIEDKEYIFINELVVEPEITLDPEIGNILLNRISVSGLNDYWAQYCEDTGCILQIINIENIYIVRNVSK